MLLRQRRPRIAESKLEKQATKQPGGIAIEELIRIANQYGLHADTARLDLGQIESLLADGSYPIVYLNRHLDRRFPLARRLALRRCVAHAVVPIRLSDRFVIFNDPRRGKSRRVTRRKFEAAQADLGNWCLVCDSAKH